jgi:HAD superfamily hydrolase (TIGR01509 family)
VRERVDAVIFDLDGILIDSEQVWDEARRQVAAEHGGHWSAEATREMIGMSSVEWSRYMHNTLGVALSPEQISETVVSRMRDVYTQHLPLIAGAREAVVRLAGRFLLGLASSANRPVIELVLELAGMTSLFAATVSSEEVARGKPAPDVYLEAARRLGVDAERCAAVEDSANGLRSASAAGMTVIAVPNREFPPDEDALAVASAVLESVSDLTPERVLQSAEARP